MLAEGLELLYRPIQLMRGSTEHCAAYAPCMQHGRNDLLAFWPELICEMKGLCLSAWSTQICDD